jgi:glycolate oxidase
MVRFASSASSASLLLMRMSHAEASMSDDGNSAEVSRDLALRASFARDASGLEMVPEGVARPQSVDEAIGVIRDAVLSGTPVTAAGNQTSTTGASITDTGLLLSLRGIDKIIDIDVDKRIARVEAGVLLGDLNRAIASEGLFFPPDPTSEDEATIGGAIACNASGARTMRYGPTRNHIRGLRVITADGAVHRVGRGSHEKNTVGYAVAHHPVDWFVGSEGTLGVVVEGDLALMPLPPQVTGIWVPFPTLDDALRFVVAARASTLLPRCLELFDDQAFAIVRGAADDPRWALTARAMIYLEDVAAVPPLDAWLALTEEHHGMTDDIQVAHSDATLRQARRLRHAVPSFMNDKGAARRQFGGRKVSTDWAVPHELLGVALRHAAEAVAKHDAPTPVVYGHAGNGHPHQNFIANDAAELERINRAVEETLHYVLELGGTISAEHGLGKLKRKWLSLQATPMEIAVMHGMKVALDPKGLMAPGNVF